MKKILTFFVAIFVFVTLVGCAFLDDDVKIVFETDGGTKIETIVASAGKKLTKPEDPVKEGFTFGGWYSDIDLTEFFEFPEKMPNKTITLYAKWLVTLSFDSKGGSSVEPILGEPGSVFVLPKDPVREGFVFVGWFYEDGTKLTYVMPKQNAKVTARWQVFEEGSAINLSNDWLINDEGSYIVTKDDEGTKITATQGKGEWSFVFVMIDGNAKANTTVVAELKGTKGATAVLKVEGGNAEASAETSIEFTGDEQRIEWTVEPKNLTSNGGQKFLIFLNGGTIGCSEEPEYVIVKRVTLYRTIDADEPQRALLSFMTNGGTEIEPYYLEPGTAIVAPKDPEKEGFVFTGWFKDADLTEPYEFTFMPQTTTLVYAGWKAAQTYLPDVDLMGGEFVGLDEGAYSIQNNAESYVLKKNAEGGEWTCMILPMTGKKLAGMNLLRVEIQGPKGAQVLFKINDENRGEHYVTTNGQKQVLEIPFDFDLDASRPLVVFLAPGVAGESGEFTITKLAYGNYSRYINLLVEGWSTLDPEIVPFALKDGILTFSKLPEEGKEWACLIIKLENVSFVNFDTVVARFIGPAGEQILIKPNNNGAFEKWINCSGEMQEVTIQLTSELLNSTDTMVLFVNPGTNGTGNEVQFVELALTMSKEPVEPEPQEEPRNVDLMGKEMTALDAGHYVIQNNEDSYVLKKTETASEWTFVVLPMTGLDLEGLSVLRVEFQGKAGEQILFKMNDDNAGERWVTMTGEKQFMEFVYNGELNNGKALVLCLTGGVAGESGELTITRLEYSNYHLILNCLDFELKPEVAEQYDLTQENGKVTVAKTEVGGEWSWFGIDPVAALDGVMVDKLIVEVKGEKDEQILFKFNDTIEKWVTCTGETQLLSFDINAELVGAKKLFVIFCNPGAAASGNSFEITKLQLVLHEEGESQEEHGPKDVNLMNRELTSMGDGEYEITISENQYVAKKTAIGGEWSAMVLPMTGLDLSNLKLLRVEFTAPENTPILFKINDENAGERWVTATGEVQYLELPFDLKLNPEKALVIFIGAGVAGETGELVITKLEYSNNPKIIDLLALDFMSVNPSALTFSKENDKLVFTKTAAANEWDWCGIGPIAEANGAHVIKMLLEVKGSEGETLVVKPNNNSAAENWLSMTGEVLLINLNVDIVINGQDNILVMFPNAGSAGTGNSFEISKLICYLE